MSIYEETGKSQQTQRLYLPELHCSSLLQVRELNCVAVSRKKERANAWRLGDSYFGRQDGRALFKRHTLLLKIT